MGWEVLSSRAGCGLWDAPTGQGLGCFGDDGVR